MTDSDNGHTRRRYVQLAAGAGIAGLAGCSGGGGGDSGGSGNGSTSETTTSSSGGGASATLEVQHWWTGGDGGDAIQSLFDGFKEKYPEVEVEQNPVSGGAGQNLKSVIKKRILNNNPPSSWQAWPGKNLLPYTEADKLVDIEESVWSHNDMKNAYMDGPMNAAKPDGNLVTVPLNIHRLNNLFYNPQVLSDAGVSIDDISTPSDLVDAMATVESETEAHGMVQATSGPWTTLQLWETIFLGEHGLDTYNTFIDGNGGDVETEAKDALSIVKQYREHWNDDSDSLSWTQANNEFISGNAAFFHNGDWAAGMYYGAEDFEYGTHWDHVAFPGTDGLYTLVMDSFPFPANNPSPEATKKFLRYVGSVDAQQRFNPKKGSIPPRTDVPKEPFNPFSQDQMDDFSNSDSQPPSIAHGLATSPETLTNLENATATFTSNWDVDATFSAYVSAFGN